MNIKNSTSNNDERSILREFFEPISSVGPQPDTVCDSGIAKSAEKQLRDCLRNSKNTCTCHKCKYTICEVCQASDRELIDLRNFYRVIRSAKKHGNMTHTEILDFIENAKKRLMN